jgi:hypothetical protein
VIFQSILAYVIAAVQMAAVMLLWIGDINFRLGAVQDAHNKIVHRRTDFEADHLSDSRSQAIQNACQDGAQLFIEMA